MSDLKWLELPTNKNDDNRSISPLGLILALNWIVVEWLKPNGAHEAIQQRERPLLKRISDFWYAKIFLESHQEPLKAMLRIYVRCGGDKKAVNWACTILKKTPEELRAGSMAMVIQKLREMGKESEECHKEIIEECHKEIIKEKQ